MTITVVPYDKLPVELFDQVYDMYDQVFAEVNELAAQRHLVTRDEFRVIADDPRLTKYLAYETGVLVGISTITNDLDAWPLASPAYYANHFPDHFRRSAIWYIGFVGAWPGHPHVFPALVSAMYPQVVNSDGLAVMDFCTFNVDRRLPDATYAMLKRMNPATQVARLDEQVTYLYRFDGNTDPIRPVLA